MAELTRWKMCQAEPEPDDDDGKWVHWEEARTVVAQLRADLAAEKRAHAEARAELQQVDADLARVRSNSLALASERDHYRSDLKQASADLDQALLQLARVKEELEQARGYAVSCSRQSQEDSARREAAETELAAARPVLEACAGIPDVTLSKWACSPGERWIPLAKALRARRLAEGFDVDADIDGFDSEGWLLARRPYDCTRRSRANEADELRRSSKAEVDAERLLEEALTRKA